MIGSSQSIGNFGDEEVTLITVPARPSSAPAPNTAEDFFFDNVETMATPPAFEQDIIHLATPGPSQAKKKKQDGLEASVATLNKAVAMSLSTPAANRTPDDAFAHYVEKHIADILKKANGSKKLEIKIKMLHVLAELEDEPDSFFPI